MSTQLNIELAILITIYVFFIILIIYIFVLIIIIIKKNLKLDFKYSMIVWDERVGDPKLKDEKEGESINMKRPCPCG